MNSKAKQSIERITDIKYMLILEGIAIGVLAGMVVSFFRLLLMKAESFRGSVLSMAENNPKMIAVVLGLLVICYLGAWLAVRLVPLCSGSGIPQVAGELKGSIFQNWWKILLAKIIGGTLAIGGGLSLGREGPSIQLGAMVGKGFSSLTDRLATEEKLLITCGAAAGLSSAFSAPLAGVVFALEGLHKNFSTDVLLGSMASSIAADFVAYNFFGLNPVFDLNIAKGLPLSMYWTILVLGIILGVMGLIYCRFTAFVQDQYDRIPQKAGRLAIPFLLVIPLAIWYPDVLGGGYRLVTAVADGEYLLVGLAVLLGMKFLFAILSFGSGAPGGIFMPLLVIGGIAGGLYFSLIGSLFGLEGEYIDNFVIYGMVGYFAAIVRSPVTGVILITEMVGDFNNFLTLSIVALLAYVTADLLGSIPIYEQLLIRMLSKGGDTGMTENLKQNKVLLESDVYLGSRMDRQFIRDMKLPRGCLIVAVQRGQQELVPSGATELRGGDRLTVLCSQGSMQEVDGILAELCRQEVMRKQ